jgi:hypothetical protein
MPVSDTERELLEQILEAQRETVGVLRGIEGILDSICENTVSIADGTAETAYMEHSFIWRVWNRQRTAWAMAKARVDMERLLDLASKADQEQ